MNNNRNKLIEEAIKLSFIIIEIIFDLFMLNYDNKEYKDSLKVTTYSNDTAIKSTCNTINSNDSSIYNSLILFDILFTNNPIILFFYDKNFDFLKYFLNYKLFLLIAILIRWYLIYVNLLTKQNKEEKIAIDKDILNKCITIEKNINNKRVIKSLSKSISIPVVIKSSNIKVSALIYIILNLILFFIYPSRNKY